MPFHETRSALPRRCQSGLPPVVALVLLAGSALACSDSSVMGGDSTTGAAFTTAPVGCTYSYNAFNSSAIVSAASVVQWSCTGSTRKLVGNGIPDHPTSGVFRDPISAQSVSISFSTAPSLTSTSGNYLSRTALGYVLNGVKLDPGTDGSCASSATSTVPGGGCVGGMGRDPWVLEAIGGAFDFGTDASNAHPQPTGQYHYHGMPEEYLAKLNKGKAMTLVGFAMDGFPIYARYGFTVATDATSPVKVLTSSWQKKTTADAGRPSVTIFPMGTFTSDYRYVAGSGDLDECNGRTGVTPEFPAGIYHYLITESFPYIQRCVKGKVD